MSGRGKFGEHGENFSLVIAVDVTRLILSCTYGLLNTKCPPYIGQN